MAFVVTAAPALADGDPAITQAPAIFGTAQVGQVLGSTPGTWEGTMPITATYQWLRCSSAGNACHPIAGETGPTYVPAPQDQGATLRIALTVTNDLGEDSARSGATSPVAAAPATEPGPAPAPAPEPAPAPPPEPTSEPAPASAPAPALVPAPATAAAPTPAIAPAAAVKPQLLDPFPLIRLRGYLTSAGARITLLSIRTRRGTRITIACSGAACPAGAERWAAPGGTTRVRRLERVLPAGVRITITVTKRGWIGKHTLIVIRRGRPPLRRDRCLYPGSALPAPCPVS